MPSYQAAVKMSQQQQAEADTLYWCPSRLYRHNVVSTKPAPCQYPVLCIILSAFFNVVISYITYHLIKSFCGPLLRVLVSMHFVVRELGYSAANVAAHHGCGRWIAERSREIDTYIKYAAVVLLALKALWWAGGL